MSILSGFKKYKNYKTDANGNHQLQSFWTSTDTVVDADGNTLTSILANLPNPMVMRGTIGAQADDPTITDLPVDGSATIGDTYRVITDGTYAGAEAKVGDLFTCISKTSSTNTWAHIPAGDDSIVIANPTGTATDTMITISIDGVIYEVIDATALHNDDVGTAAFKDINNEYDPTSEDVATGQTINDALDSMGSQTVTGNPLTITDASPNKAEKIEIGFEPKQDKHGYESVWVGGAGKNKLMSPVKSITSRQVTFTCDGNGKITANGTASGTPDQCYIDVQTEFGALKKGGTYKIVSNGDIYFNILVQVNGSYTKIVDASKSATFTIDANATQIFIRAVPYFNGYEYNNAVSYPVIVESTETDTSFSPYSNISPITGYTSLSADGCGKNVWDGTNSEERGYLLSDGSIASSNYWRVTSYIPVNEGNYTLSFSGSLTFNGSYICFYDENKNFISSFDWTTSKARTVLAPNNAKYMRASYYSTITDLMVEKGSQATPYDQFKGDNVTVQFGQTLYGGKLTILQDGSADVYCDTGFGEFDGSSDENWTLVDNNSIKTDYIFPAMKTATSTWIYAFSSDFSAGADGVAPSTWLTTYATNNPTALEFRNIVSNWGISAYTVNAWKSYLASRSTPLQVAYELKDPFTLHLSPVETLTILQGINNVWTDGTTLSLTYQPDNIIGEVKGDIQEINEEIQGSKEIFGNPITVTDAAPIYAEKVKVDLEAQQDLHGYDKPWVGGAGKNKLPIKDTIATTTINGVTFTVEKDTDGNVVSIDVDSNGSPATGLANFELTTFTSTKNGTILSGCPSGGNYSSSYSLAIVDNNYASIFIDQGSGVNITSDTAGCKVVIFVRSGYTISHKKFYPMIRESGQTATYEPPSNICPIQGYDIVSVDRCGKNLFGDFQYGYTTDSSGKIIENANSWICKLKCDNTKEKVYLKIFDKGTYTGSFWIEYSLDGETFTNIGITIQFPQISNGYTANANIPQGTKYLLVGGFMSSHGTNHNIASVKAQVEYSAVGDTYEPLNKQTVSLQLGNKNLLPMTVDKLKEINTSGSWSGNVYTLNNATFTVFTDKDVLITGIKINTSSAVTTGVTFNVGTNLSYNAGRYILSTGDNVPSNLMFSIQTEGGNATISSGNSITVTNKITNSLCWIYIPNTVSVSNYTIKPMLRSATVTDPTFSPYNPSLGGMVYGGQLTLNDDGSAVFVGDKAEVVYDGSSDESWSRLGGSTVWGDYTMYTSLSGIKYTDGDLAPNIKTNYLNAIPFNPSWASYDGFISKNPNNDVLYTAIKSITTVADWKTYLALNPLQVTYPLSKPFTIHLSAEQLKLLQGTNNVWSNAGNVTLKYQPDNVIAEPKADVQRLRDYVDTVARDNYSRNIFGIDNNPLMFNVYGGKVETNTTHGSISVANGGIISSGRNASTGISVLLGYLDVGTYTVSVATKNATMYVTTTGQTYPANGVSISDVTSSESNSITFTLSEAKYINLGFFVSSNIDLYCTNIQLEYGKDQTPYDTYIPTNKELWEMTPTKTSDLTNDSGFVTTDEKVTGQVYDPSSGPRPDSYNIPFVDYTTNQKPYINNGLTYNTKPATTSVVGLSSLWLGNNISTAATGSKAGQLRLYGENEKYVQLKTDTLLNDRTILLPDADGTVALTTSNVASATSATKATQDGNGNVITSTYAKKTSVEKVIEHNTASSWSGENWLIGNFVGPSTKGVYMFIGWAEIDGALGGRRGIKMVGTSATDVKASAFISDSADSGYNRTISCFEYVVCTTDSIAQNTSRQLRLYTANTLSSGSIKGGLAMIKIRDL